MVGQVTLHVAYLIIKKAAGLTTLTLRTVFLIQNQRYVIAKPFGPSDVLWVSSNFFPTYIL